MSKYKKYFVNYGLDGWPVSDANGPLARKATAELLNNQKEQIDHLTEVLKHLYHNAKDSGAELGLALDVAEEVLERYR